MRTSNSRTSDKYRSGGSTLAALRASGDSAAGLRNSLAGSTVTRVGLDRTRPSTSRIFLDRQTGPHQSAGINVRIRAGHPHLLFKPIVAPRPKVVIHKDTTIIHHDTNIIHTVPVSPAPVMYDDYYYDDYGYYDDGYYADAVYGYTDYNDDNGYRVGGGGYYAQDWEVDPYYDNGAEYATDNVGYYDTIPWYDDGVGYPIRPGYTGLISVEPSPPSWYAYSDQYYGWPQLYRRLWFGCVSPYDYYRLSYYWNRFTDYWWETCWPTFWRSHLTLGLRF